MNPLDALQALNGMAVPTAGLTPSVPGPAVSERFSLPETLPSSGLAPMPTTDAITVASPGTWGHMVQQMVMDVNSRQQNAAQMVGDVLKGGPTPVHAAMVASEEASLSFAFLSEARNKVVEAYQQVMQMQV